MKKYITIEGMKCQGCENRVKEALESLYFVRLAVVNHEAGSAIVKMPVEVPDDILKECIEELGYKVKSIERLLCGCKNIREIDVKNLIESGVNTTEAILEQTGLGSFGCCSKDIVRLLIDKYKNGKDIDIQSEVFKINKKNDYTIAVNDAKRQIQAAQEATDAIIAVEKDCGCQ